MKLKAFKIWLYLLPVVAVIGVLLFVQSSNNQSELQQQHIRSIASLSKDIQLALPDYLRRVDAFLMRQAYIYSDPNPLKDHAEQIQKIRMGFQPNVSNLRFLKKETLPKTEMSVDHTTVVVKNQPVHIPPPHDVNFIQAVRQSVGNKTPLFKGPIPESSVLVMDIEIPIRDLFEKLLANDFIFEKFYLTDSKGIVVFPDESTGTKLFEPKDLIQDSTGLTHSGITFSRIILDGNEFHAYANPINLGPNRLYFVGLYDSDYFLKVGLRINYNWLSTLLFILVMLIASIPILAVVKMGRGDNLTQGRVIQAGISLMILAVVIGFSISFTKNRPIPSSIVESNIKASRDTLLANLTPHHSLLKIWRDPEGIIPREKTNELIQVNSETGYVNQIMYFEKNKPEPLWITFNSGPSFVYLKDRPYIKYFDREKKSPTYLDSHYSRGTGLLETVIAYQDPISSKSNIHAVTFSLELDSVMTNSHRILLIKEDGKVIFKSKKVESSISNLSESINPDKWKEVSSLLKNNGEIQDAISLHVPLYLNGHQYQGIFRRINSMEFDKSLWQVFLVNSNIYHAFSALTSLEGVIFLSFYFVFFLLTLFAQWSTRTGSNSKGFKSFLFEWLVPNDKNKPRLIFLMLGYLIFSIVLFGILRTTPLNPFHTLAFLTFSSLNISFINLASAQVRTIREEKKISTELLVLLGILLFTYVLVPIFIRRLLPGMSVLLITSFLIIIGWSILRPKKEEIPYLKYFKSSKNTLSAYLVFWFFLIGFLPGYLIQSKTQQFETTIWNRSETSNCELSAYLLDYEKARRNMLAALSDPFDSKIQDFVSPDVRVLRSAWDGTETQLSSNPLVYIGFFLLVFATYLVVRWIQNSIFFDLKPEYGAPQVLEESANFICCINSNQIPDPEPDTIIIDLKIETFPEGFLVEKRSYRLINFHCVENPMALVLPISQIKNAGRNLSIYSGSLWKNIYNGLKSDREKSIFSEVFSDFKFSVIEIKDVENGPMKNEGEVLARLKRNKAFYSNIWSDLSFEEKLVCNSYAKEGFFNPARRDTMVDLTQKGIIVPKAYSDPEKSWIEWRLFSPSFRQYILTHSSEEEAASFGAYEQKHGNVRTIQTAVISFVLICIALVGIFDKTFFNEAYTYLTGGLGVLGTLYSFLNQGFAGLRGPKKEG